MSYQTVHTILGQEPVLIADLKLYLRTDYDTDDTLIISLISAAREQAERFCNRSFVRQQIEFTKTITIEEARSNYVVKLPFPNHNVITQVKINGVVTTDYSTYGTTQLTLSVPNMVILDGTTMIDLYIKYTTTSDCPELVKVAIKNIAKDLTENRNEKALLSNAYQLLSTFKVYN